MSNAIVFPDTESAMQACGVGSVFERVPHGWKVKFVDGGTQVFVEGATIAEALASHGTQVVHPVKEVPQGIVEVESHDQRETREAEERRAADQDAAMEQAFIEAKLPEEDRRTIKKKKVATDGE